jgi:hypothetical protein
MKPYMTYEEYIRHSLLRAKANDESFAEGGNSTTAVCNQSFWFSYKKSAVRVIRELRGMLSDNPLHYSLGDILTSLVMITTFPLTILARTIYKRKSAKVYMMTYYEEDRDNYNKKFEGLLKILKKGVL